MIEIKEDTKIFDGVDNAEFEKEYQIKDIDELVRKQILQDHEKAKNYDHYLRELHLTSNKSIPIQELDNFIRGQAQEHIQAKKDRQIVKRLEEKIKDHNKKLNEIIKIENGTKSCGSDFHLRLLDNRDNLQKILEGKK